MYSEEPLTVALHTALRVQRGNRLGRYNRRAFEREVAEAGGWSLDTVAGYFKGARRPTPALMTEAARLLELPAGAAYFMEFRLWQVSEVLNAHPDAMVAFYAGIMQVALDKDGRVPEA